MRREPFPPNSLIFEKAGLSGAKSETKLERPHTGGGYSTTFNVGCWPDSWGDVRVDVDYHAQTGILSRLNLMADVHSLPFIDEAFREVRCFPCSNTLGILIWVPRIKKGRLDRRGSLSYR